MDILTLTTERLARHFERATPSNEGAWIERGGVRALPALSQDLDAVFESILRTANAFVPAEAGSILLEQRGANGQTELVFVACYGDHAATLLGHTVPADCGVVGLVYRSARPYLSGEPPSDPNFYEGIDATIGFNTQNLLAVPILFDGEVRGVLELLNHRGGAFAPRDLDLLNVFAGYISSSIRNALDARFAHELAKLDELSGLYNDRYLHQVTFELVDEALQRESTLAMLFMDLDSFKRVNDRHGHLAGAAVLSEVGQLIAGVLPEGAIAARYGGDEYVIVWPDASLQDATAYAERLLAQIKGHIYLRRPQWLDAPVLHLEGLISASIGVAELRALGLHTWLDPRAVKNSLIRAADAAMYEAKARGKSQVVASERPRVGDEPAS